MIVLPQEYEINSFGFIHQKSHSDFKYTVEYKKNQGTNIEMSYLRLGWLYSFVPYAEVKTLDGVDIGCGSGLFIECCKDKMNSIVGYDVVGESISREELYGKDWGIIFLYDVLEHFEDINDLFKLKWKYAMISFPETPKVKSFDELTKWRHFKPNEHLWCLNAAGFLEWVSSNGCSVIGFGNFEDSIRKRWDPSLPNVSSFLLAR